MPAPRVPTRKPRCRPRRPGDAGAGSLDLGSRGRPRRRARREAHGRPGFSCSAVPWRSPATAAGRWSRPCRSPAADALQLVLVVLFCLTFSWIALAFTSGLLGFALLLRRKRPDPVPTALHSRTAVLMPVYNEATARTFAGVEAMARPWRLPGSRPFRLVRPLRFDAARCLDRRGARLPRPAPPPRPRRPALLPAPAQEPSPQGRQYRRLRHPLGRPLRPHAGARRRQPDERPGDRGARGRLEADRMPASSRPR